MLIYDVLHKEKVYQSVVNELRNFGIKHRLKKNLIKNEKMEKNDKNSLKKIFKVPLSYQSLEVVNLSSGAIVHVPIFLCQTTSYLEKFLTQEGIFRKAGSQLRQKDLIQRLDNGGTIGDKNHSIDVANCLKTFFRDLPEPLIPYAFHDLFVRCLMLRNRRVEAILLVCILLPSHHLNTLAFLMDFLKNVSKYENDNKMGIDNLAKVFGPNLMPLQETTMSAVQSRLEAHLVIIKILIENAENIGVLPENIAETISAESIGSVETELDHSDSSSRQRNKKKKHRSGSLTRMFNGLKKMVGKSSPGEVGQINNQLVSTDFDSLHTPTIKVGKKRKVAEPAGPVSVKKKREILDTMLDRTGQRPLFASPVSSNPNPVRERSPVHKSKVRKYLTHKIHSEMRGLDKVDKPKKLRMSLDRFVSRSKQKVAEVETSKDFYSPCIERRWSSASSSSAQKKNREKNDKNSPLLSPSIRKATTLINVRDDYDRIFMEANVNLSDDNDQNCENFDKIETENRPSKRSRLTSCRRSLDANFTPKKVDKNFSSNRRESFDKNEKKISKKSQNSNFNEEYVRIPKSEYEEIKNRVSAIESRISQEFSSIVNETDPNIVKNVQNEYEKTLIEASIENTLTADNLAKKLSKELKIRRSCEQKIIRSPSARKIGILRRRSQEKLPNRRISRNASWHITQKNDERKNLYDKNYYDNIRQDTCSDDTNARLNYLQETLHTLINHTAEHTGENLSDDDDEVFVTKNKLSKIRRASSFHGNEFIDNSRYFNNRVKELKISNNQNNFDNDKKIDEIMKNDEKIEKIISWKDADGYLKFDGRGNFNTPIQQTGRASIAKLRTQNAGMVLAKAKLFDDTKDKITNDKNIPENEKNCEKISRIRDIKNVDIDDNTMKKSSIRRKNGKSPKNNNSKIRLNSTNYSSPLIKMELTILPTTNNSRQNDNKRINNRRNSNKNEHENREIYRNSMIINDDNFIDKTDNFNVNHNDKDTKINIYNSDGNSNCKTPHIKKSLAVKTPKSARSLARRPAIDTRRTPLKAVPSLGTPKRYSPRTVLKSRQLSKPVN